MNLPLCTIIWLLGSSITGSVFASGEANRSNGTAPVITEQPEDVLADDKDEIVRLYCRATGTPKPKITWYKDGIALSVKPVKEVILFTEGDLMIQEIIDKPPDPNTGKYQCVATNSAGSTRSRNATVRLSFIRKMFRISPMDQTVNRGSQAVMHCQAPRGFPEPTVTWKKDGRQMVTSRRVKVRSGDLVITRVVKGDAGTYVCVAASQAGVEESRGAVLTVQDPPRFQVRPKDQTVRSGHSVTLECKATGDPRPVITWTRANGEIPIDRSSQSNSGNLIIGGVRYSDQGKYTCRAENIAGSVTADARLSVEGLPEFTKVSVDSDVEIGGTATLECKAKGNPQPAVAWFGLDGREIFPATRMNNMVVTDDGKLFIYNVNFRQDGIYRCKAFNSIGITYTDVRLAIKPRSSTIPPPVIRRGPQNSTCRLGGAVTLTCSSDATPRPDVVWYKDGLLVTNPRKLAAAGELRITDALNEDAGRYTCKVMNDYGMSSWDAWIRVVGNGRAVPDQPDVDDFPSAPERPQMVNSTMSSVAIRWQASARPGSAPILHYDVDYYNIGSEATSWERLSKVKGTVAVVKGLIPTSKYVFLVRAVNAMGYSEPSAVSREFVTQEFRPPTTTAPLTTEQLQLMLDQIDIRLTRVVKFHHAPDPTGSFRLIWTAESTCSDVDSFEVAWQPLAGDDDGVQLATASCSTSSYDLADVMADVTYQVKIRPMRNKLKGRGSPLEFVSLERGNTPPQPPVIKPQRKDDGSVTLYWAPPSGVEENRISGYSVRCRSKDGSFVKVMNVSGEESEMTLNDLPHDGALMLSVTYSTLLGEGATSREAEVPFGVTTTTDSTEGDGFVTLFKQPAIIAGFALGGIFIIGAVVFGVCWYKRSKRNRKARGLHVRSFSFTPQSGPHRVSTHRYDGSIPFANAFQIAPTSGAGGVGNSGGGAGGLGGGANPSAGSRGNPGGGDGGHMFMQSPSEGRMHSASNVTKNTIVTYDAKNETVSNQVDEKPLGVSHPSFSYVTDQLTSMSDIPPQFSKTNLSRPSIASTQSCPPVQQQMQHQQLMRNRSGNSNVFASDPHDSRFQDTPSSSASNIRGVGDLPPPPPSPPLSQRTAVSDRSRGSSGAIHSTGERSGRGQRSRRRPQGGGSGTGSAVTVQYTAAQFTNVDTDTGIDSPHQTPSPHRPVTISSTAPPTPPVRGASSFPYERGQPVMQFNTSQDPTLNLGYLAGPSEGDTDVENDQIGQLRTRQFLNDPNHRNSVAVSAVSMMNTYGSASDQEGSTSDEESVVSSDDESLQMESVSQVGQNRNLIDAEDEDRRRVSSRPNPHPRHFMTPQHQQPQQHYTDQHHYPNTYHRHPDAQLDEDVPLIRSHQDAPATKPRPGRRGGNKSRRQRASNKDLSRLNSASSSTSSSYQHNTGDSGMSAGVGCSTEHSSLNSNASATSGNVGAVSRSRTAGNLSSYDSAPANEHHVTSEEDVNARREGNYSTPVSPAASCVSEQSGYHSTGSSCWQYHEPHKVAAQAPRRAAKNDLNADVTPTPLHHNTHSLGERSTNHPKLSQRFYPNTMGSSNPSMQECALAPTDGDATASRGGPQFQLARTVLVGGIGGKAVRGRPQELSDVPEVSTSDFCEDYSDQSQ